MVRTLLVALPSLVRDILVPVFQERADIALVGELPDAGALRDTVRELRPDVVLWALGAGADGPAAPAVVPDACLRLLYDAPHVRVLGLDDTNGRLSVYALRPVVRHLGDLAPADLADVVVGAVP